MKSEIQISKNTIVSKTYCLLWEIWRCNFWSKSSSLMFTASRIHFLYFSKNWSEVQTMTLMTENIWHYLAGFDFFHTFKWKQRIVKSKTKARHSLLKKVKSLQNQPQFLWMNFCREKKHFLNTESASLELEEAISAEYRFCLLFFQIFWIDIITLKCMYDQGMWFVSWFSVDGSRELFKHCYKPISSIFLKNRLAIHAPCLRPLY